MIRLPKKLHGSTPDVHWKNQVIDYLASLTPVETPTIKPITDHRGTGYNSKPGGGGSAPGVSLTPFMLQTVQDNYTTCFQIFTNQAGNITPGAVPIYIAKPPELWMSITKEWVDGNFQTYTYGDTTTNGKYGWPDAYWQRTAKFINGDGTGTITEQQVIVPRYLPGRNDLDGTAATPSMIFALRLTVPLFQTLYDDKGHRFPVEWQEVSSRAWCQAAFQSL